MELKNEAVSSKWEVEDIFCGIACDTLFVVVVFRAVAKLAARYSDFFGF